MSLQKLYLCFLLPGILFFFGRKESVSINLGSKFHFNISLSGNEVIYSPMEGEPRIWPDLPLIVRPVIVNVQSLAFNDSLIAVISTFTNKKNYRIIDKMKATEVNDRVKEVIEYEISNIESFDSLHFHYIIKKKNLDLKTPEYYLKTDNYERIR